MTLREAKVGIGVVGMLLAAGGVLTGNRIVVWVAIAVLGLALMLRILERKAPPPP